MKRCGQVPFLLAERARCNCESCDAWLPLIVHLNTAVMSGEGGGKPLYCME